MRRTDDFIADLDAQLAAAAARLPGRRRSPRVLLRPLAVAAVAAAAVTAFVLAAGSGGEPERAAQPPRPVAAEPFTLPQAERCGVAHATSDEPPAEVLDELAVLRRAPAAGEVGSIRRARADVRVSLMPMQEVGECADGPPDVAGVCMVVEVGEPRAPCFSLDRIRRHQAAAALGNGFLIAVLPDGVQEVTFVIGAERDTYRVTDNVVIANLEGARAGARVQMLAGGAPSPSGCGEGQVLDSPLPSELSVAVPVLVERRAMDAPDHVMDVLARAGANRIWAGEARWLQTAGNASVWVVPVADSRFAECGDPLVTAPRGFEGPGVCAVVQPQTEDAVKAVLCRDLDELGEVIAPRVDGGRLAVAFLPHGATSLQTGGERLHDTTPPNGLVAGIIPSEGGTPGPVFAGPGGSVDPNRAEMSRIEVLAPSRELAERVRDRLARVGLEIADAVDALPPGEGSRVLYASGMAPAARQVAELLRLQDHVLPLDAQTQALAGNDADIVVLAGEDARR